MVDVSVQHDLTSDDIDRLIQSNLVAVDTETTGLNANRDLLCLVQLCDAQGNITVIRTKEWSSCTGLRQFFSTPGVLKIIHYALFDCSFLQKNLDVEISDIYCTRTASKLARTYSGAHSLQNLVGELLKVSLDKSQQTTFWCGDHLTDEQIAYASTDVQYLIPLRDELEKILAAKGYLPSGISYLELNERCQRVIPTLVQLRLNGWEMPRDQGDWVF